MPKPRSDLGKKNLINENLIELRHRRNLSQCDLAHELQLAGCDVDKNVITRIETQKRYVTISSLSDPELINYARQNGKNTFSRKRKMPFKDMLLCCLSKKGLTTAFELRNYFKEKGDLSM